jgi:23S rRNA pseudouridine1911/1915/1917 synthase
MIIYVSECGGAHMKIIISANDAGKSVFDVLRRDIKISTRMLTRLKQSESGILVNGVRVTVRFVLCQGDILEIESESEPRREKPLVMKQIPLDIIYEDEDIIAVNKPYDMPTHPSHRHYDDTLANALAWYYRDRAFTFRAVSRLDRDTSGIVVIAKNQLAAARMSRSHIDGKIEKTYIAILQGEMEQRQGIIEGYIRRLGDTIIERGNFKSGIESEYAKTLYRVLCVRDGASLVLVRPLTGRTHQIRVHFSSIGYPLEGDEIYGGSHVKIGRQALHALSLTFPHPSKEQIMTLYAPPPEDMLGLSVMRGFKIGETFEKE